MVGDRSLRQQEDCRAPERHQRQGRHALDPPGFRRDDSLPDPLRLRAEAGRGHQRLLNFKLTRKSFNNSGAWPRRFGAFVFIKDLA